MKVCDTQLSNSLLSCLNFALHNKSALQRERVLGPHCHVPLMKKIGILTLQRRGHSLNAASPSKSNMGTRGPKMADGVWNGVYL